MQSDLHQGETERRTFLLAPSVLSLGIQPLECVCIHLKNASLLPLCGTCELVNVSKPLCLAKAGVLGAHPSGRSLKNWEHYMWGPNRQGEAGNARDGVYGKSVFQPFLSVSMWVFSHLSGV